MKKLLLTLVAFCAALAAAAQTPDTTAAEGYRFTDVKLIPMTPVKDQSRSGTCWCYSTLSFLEGEILRAGGAPVHLSEMWIVRHTFMEKAVKYIRMHGEINFAEGGASRDVTEGIPTTASSRSKPTRASTTAPRKPISTNSRAC